MDTLNTASLYISRVLKRTSRRLDEFDRVLTVQLIVVIEEIPVSNIPYPALTLHISDTVA